MIEARGALVVLIKSNDLLAQPLKGSLRDKGLFLGDEGTEGILPFLITCSKKGRDENKANPQESEYLTRLSDRKEVREFVILQFQEDPLLLQPERQLEERGFCMPLSDLSQFHREVGCFS